MKAFLLLAILFFVWVGVEAALLERVSFLHPEQPSYLSSSKHAHQNTLRTYGTKRVDEEFRSSWVAEFNDLIPVSPKEFGEHHNVHVTRFGNTNKYVIKQKMASLGRDTEKEVL